METKELILNMGPQHPSTHGVLRLILSLNGETIVHSVPDIGYLHRGIEKLAENRTYLQFLPITDRLDYIAAFPNNLAYCQTVEKLMGLEVPPRAQYIRVILTELNRISSHLVWLATHALDIGAMTVFLYCFRERETILDLFEMATGARMTFSFFRFGGVADDLPREFIPKAREFLEAFPACIADYEALLTKNRIWLARTRNVAVISAEDGINLGMSGPSLRGSGVKWDIRRAAPYAIYDQLDFEIPVGQNGDVYDRYLVRVEEMRQSSRIVRQCLDRIPEGEIRAQVPRAIKPPAGEAYSCVESPKGELGFYIVSDGSERPYRLKVRAPSFVNLESLPVMMKGGLVADVIAAIGSIDIVLGEVDR
ncbi:MAG: NADH-quinone oxidoreductase subunit D [Nitrospinae bacterium]|nr:NADH-quinone oxidoreductase subunit D [Nitrospinota bacterium]